MKKFLSLLLVSVILLISLSACQQSEELYEIYEMRQLIGTDEPYIVEYPYLQTPLPQDAPETAEITFLGEKYQGKYKEGSAIVFDFLYGGLEALFYYEIYEGEENIGAFQINEKSGTPRSVFFNVDKESIYNSESKSLEELETIAEEVASQYIDTSKYHYAYKYDLQQFTNDTTKKITQYTFTYYKNVNGIQCMYDNLEIKIYHDGTIQSVDIVEPGNIDKDSYVHFDSLVLNRTIEKKLKSTQRYIDYANGEFEYTVNSMKILYYVFEDGEIGMWVELMATIIPNDSTIKPEYTRLMYIVKK